MESGLQTETQMPGQGARVAIGLGSNLGDSQQIMQQALAALNATAGVVLKQFSSFYSTKPIGPPQPDYVNACSVVETTLAPLELLRCMQGIEQDFARVRLERWGPRTLDLDILLWDDAVLDLPELQVPHPRMAERGFVLVPLGEIAPHWRHPLLGEAIAKLLPTVDCSGVEKLPSLKLS